MKKVSNLLWGIVLIVIGVVFGLNVLDITDINIFFDGWWTLFIIVPSFIDLFTEDEKTGSIIGLLIGVCLLLCCQDVLEFDIILKLMLPVILVIVGVSLIFKDSMKAKIKEEITKLNKKNPNSNEYCAMFGGQNVNFSKEEFNGCELNAVFGGIKCDLTDSIIKNNTVINVSAIFGGITIYAPQDVNIKVVSSSVLGGVSDERKVKSKDSKITIYINASCIFGGVEIK